MKNEYKSGNYMVLGGRISKVGKVVVSVAALGLFVAGCDYFTGKSEPVMGAKRIPEKNMINPGVEKENTDDGMVFQNNSVTPSAPQEMAAAVPQAAQDKGWWDKNTSWVGETFASAERKMPVENQRMMMASAGAPAMNDPLADSQLAALPPTVQSAPVTEVETQLSGAPLDTPVDMAAAPQVAPIVDDNDVEVATLPAPAPMPQALPVVERSEQAMATPSMPNAPVPAGMELPAPAVAELAPQMVAPAPAAQQAELEPLVDDEEVVAELSANGPIPEPVQTPAPVTTASVDDKGYPLLGATPETPERAQAFRNDRAAFDGKMQEMANETTNVASQPASVAPLDNEASETELASIPGELPWKKPEVVAADRAIVEKEEFGDAAVTYADAPAETAGIAPGDRKPIDISTIPEVEEVVASTAPAAPATPSELATQIASSLAVPAESAAPAELPAPVVASAAATPVDTSAYDRELVETAAITAAAEPVAQPVAQPVTPPPSATELVEQAVAGLPEAEHGSVSLAAATPPAPKVDEFAEEKPQESKGLLDALLAPFTSDDDAKEAEVASVSEDKHLPLGERTADEIKAAAQPAPAPLMGVPAEVFSAAAPVAPQSENLRTPLDVVSGAPAVQEAAPAAGYETAQVAAEPGYIDLVPPSARQSGEVRYLPQSRYASRIKPRPATENRH